MPSPVSGTSRNIPCRQLRAISQTCGRMPSQLRRPRRTTCPRPSPSRPAQASQAPPRPQCQLRLSPSNPGSRAAPALFDPQGEALTSRRPWPCGSRPGARSGCRSGSSRRRPACGGASSRRRAPPASRRSSPASTPVAAGHRASIPVRH